MRVRTSTYLLGRGIRFAYNKHIEVDLRLFCRSSSFVVWVNYDFFTGPGLSGARPHSFSSGPWCCRQPREGSKPSASLAIYPGCKQAGLLGCIDTGSQVSPAGFPNHSCVTPPPACLHSPRWAAGKQIQMVAAAEAWASRPGPLVPAWPPDTCHLR